MPPEEKLLFWERLLGERPGWGVTLKYIFVVLVFVFFAFPIFWIVTLSFKTTADLGTFPPKWIFKPTLVQYADLLIKWPFLKYYLNSFIVVSGSLLVALAFGVPLAYALARFEWRFKNDISFFILAQLMLPPAGVVLPFYLLCSQLGILKTLWAPMLVYILFTLPFIAWLMKGFFESLPVSVEEAALVDGCTRFQVFRRIVLPLVLGQLTSTTMLAAIFTWNEFFFALVLTGADTYTAPVAITGLWTDNAVFWGQIAAGGVLISLPMVITALVIQRYLVRGLTFGAVK